MMSFTLTVAGAALALILAGCAGMGPGAPVKFSGGMLTDSAGMTLYTFDKDAAGSGKSVCNGPCATNWPPLKATADDKPGGNWSIITRDDGSRQWAYKGKPVYLWSKDRKPGDKTGDGFNNAWHSVKQEPVPGGYGRSMSGY
jgi:predicted lipoprotein with Yx(FWY)xxD motif